MGRSSLTQPTQSPPQELPPELGRLSRLETLELSDNRWAGAGSGAGCGRWERHAFWQGRPLPHPAACLACQQQGAWPLPLPALAILPRSLALAPAARRLALLPPQLCRLSRLASLACRSNGLRELPADLGSLRALTYLDCRCAALPGPQLLPTPPSPTPAPPTPPSPTPNPHPSPPTPTAA